MSNHPKSRKGQAAADLNVANTLLSLQTPVDHEKSVQPVQKQEEVDDEKIKVYSRRKNKTDEASTSNTKSVVGKRIAQEQEKQEKRMEKAKSQNAKRLKVKKHGKHKRIAKKNAVIKAESSLPMAIDKVPKELEKTGDEPKEREMDDHKANIAETSNNAAEFVGEPHAEKSSDDDVAEALLSLHKLPEAQHTEHEMQDRVGDVQHVHQQPHVDSDMTLKESGEKKIHVASSSKKIKKGKGIANKKGEKGRKKAKLEKDTLKSLQIRLNKLDERWTEHVPRLTRLGIKIPSEDSPDHTEPSPEIHDIAEGNGPEKAPLIEDVRNEVAEPAGDEHNGMEAEGSSREMVLAESAPQKGKMDVENVPRLTRLGIKIPSEDSPDQPGHGRSPSPEIHGIGAGNSPETAPLIEDVRNEVAEPAGDEHNGMEAEGNGREMVLAEVAENAPQEEKMEVENVNYDIYDHGPMEVADYADYSAAFSPSRLDYLDHPALSWHPHTHQQMELSGENDSVHAHRDNLHEFWGTPYFN